MHKTPQPPPPDSQLTMEIQPKMIPTTAPLTEALTTALAHDISQSLPAGNLRDLKSEFSQQQIIMVSSTSTTSPNRKRKLLYSSQPRTNTNEYLTNLLWNAATATSRKRPRVMAQQKKDKSVRFVVPAESKNTTTTTSFIPRTVCQEDLPVVWYNKNDYRSFREDSHSLALAFELGILDRINPEDFCLRGLEASLSSCHLQARVEARGSVIECVLRTQEAQKGHGIKDPEMIRGLSLVLSKNACEDALKLAAYDREEAIAVLQDEEDQQR